MPFVCAPLHSRDENEDILETEAAAAEEVGGPGKEREPNPKAVALVAVIRPGVTTARQAREELEKAKAGIPAVTPCFPHRW